MKERPILMTPENAQKCHDGTKTQTRRVVKLPLDRGTWGPFLFEGSKCTTAYGKPGDDMVCISNMKTGKTIACPYGQVGDRLWVRENGWERPARTPKMLRDGADTWERFYFDALLDYGEAEDLKGYGFKRRPSIHMHRAFCRTVLEITEVRVERLQAIGEEDAIAEGVEFHNGGGIGHSGYRHVQSHGFVYGTPTEAFKVLWESINGKGSWSQNPWVWVIAFKKVRPQ